MHRPCARPSARTATLLLKAGVPLARVQRVLRHSDPRLTAMTYGHLDVSDMRGGLNDLANAAIGNLPVAARRLLPSNDSPAPRPTDALSDAHPASPGVAPRGPALSEVPEVSTPGDSETAGPTPSTSEEAPWGASGRRFKSCRPDTTKGPVTRTFLGDGPCFFPAARCALRCVFTDSRAAPPLDPRGEPPGRRTSLRRDPGRGRVSLTSHGARLAMARAATDLSASPWARSSPFTICFKYSPSRSGETAARVLGESEGKLVVDAFGGYNVVTMPGGRVRIGCLAHYLERGTIRSECRSTLRSGNIGTSHSR